MEDTTTSSSRNVYLVADNGGGKKKRKLSRVDDEDSSLEARDRKVPHWTKSPDDEAEYADWKINVRFDDDDNNNDRQSNRLSEEGSTSVAAGDDDGGSNEVVFYYSVHRFIIGRQSEYFKSIFRRLDNDNNGFAESHKKRSTIKFSKHTVVTRKHFETLLNYLYDTTGATLALIPSNAVAMVYLADYFGIKLLKERVQTFIRSKIEIISSKRSHFDVSELLATFYRDAKSMAMGELQDAIAHVCAARPYVLSKHYDLSKMDDIQFWYRVCRKRKDCPDLAKNHTMVRSSWCGAWCANVTDFIEMYSDFIDNENFCRLIEKESLATIYTVEEALILLKEEHMRIWMLRLMINLLVSSNGAWMLCTTNRTAVFEKQP